MTVTLTYDSSLARVRINATGLGIADEATVERSTDQVRWTTVRGGGAVGVTGGVFDLPLYDYEWSSDVINYYRVRGVSTAPITFRASSSGVTDANAAGNSTLSPALPAGIVADQDLLIIQASIRNSGTGTVNVPTGWTAMLSAGNIALLGRRYRSGDVAPTVTFTGGVANASLIAKMYAFPNADITPATSATLLNASAQNIAYPGLTITDDDQLILIGCWKQDDWTSPSVVAGMTQIGTNSTTLGDDAAQALDYVVQTTASDVAAGSFTITGGAAAISRGWSMALTHAPYLQEQTASILPSLGTDCGDSAIWLKSIARPFLNLPVTVVNPSSITISRPARVGIFDIVGRTNPIAVSDIRTSRRWTMFVRTETADTRDNLDLLLASGDVLLIHTPADCAVPSGYVAVGDAQQETHPLRPLRVTHTLPCTEVAPPGPDVVGAQSTWQSVLNAYGSWSAVIAAKLTWADLLALIGSPSEVIVP